jgi:hypothetical protein
MDVRLAVGRIGDHVGKSGDLLFAVDYVSADTLLDPVSLDSLRGKPIDVNHDGQTYGKVVSVDSELINGVLHCDAVIDDPTLIEYLGRAKSQNLTLETSPSFTSEISVDDKGRRIQHSRKYVALSILTNGIPGRGGSDVRVMYKYTGMPMDELIAKIDALAASLQAMTDMFKSYMEKDMVEDVASTEYETGVAEGKAIAKTEYAMTAMLQAKGIELKKAESVEELLALNLPSLGVDVTDKSYAYMAAAFDLLPSFGRVQETKPVAKSEETSKLTVKFGRGK